MILSVWSRLVIAGLSGDVLGAWFSAQNAARNAAANTRVPVAQTLGSTRDKSVLPPWDPRGEVTALDAVRRSVLASGQFFDSEASKFSRLDVSQDEKKLYAMFAGLRALQSLSAAASDRKASATDLAFWNRRFQEGLGQMDEFFSKLRMDEISMLKNTQLTRAESEVAVRRGISEYTTGIIHRGPADQEAAAFAGDVQFTVSVRKNGGDINVAIDLSEMGATPRTMGNVTSFINSKLEEQEIITRFSAVRVGEVGPAGIVTANDWALRINGVLTEQVSFSAPAARPAIYMAGVTGSGDGAAGQLSKIIGLDGTPTVQFAQRIEADATATEVPLPGGETRTSSAPNPLTIDAITQAPDGGIYVVGRTTSSVAGQDIRGEADLVLIRYDSNGKQVWSRVLGAAGEANGASVAVDSAGNIVVAGSVQGALGGTSDLGGEDSLVVKFNADGVEQWTQRFGAAGNDRANAVTIGEDGTIYVAGEARGSFGGMINQGSLDGYVRAISADGTVLYTRGVEAAEGIERARAVATAADGGLLVASEVDGRAVLTKFAPGDDGTGVPAWTLDMGSLGGGRITALAVDEDGAIYLTGGAGEAFAPSAPLAGNEGGRDAFLVRIEDGASASVSYTTFLGTGFDDLATGIQVSGGKVYLSGTTNGALPGANQNGTRNAFAAGFDAATGAHEWTQQISGRGGVSQGAGILVDPQGDSILSKLGLPNGKIVYSDSRVVTAQSAARAGDHFFISVNGGRSHKITIAANETMRSLTFKLNAALLLGGTAAVGRRTGEEFLRITPRDGVSIELKAGPEGQNALASLGLPSGTITGKSLTKKSTRDESAAAPPTFSLRLGGSYSIASRDGALAANEVLTEAMTVIQRAWRELTQDPALKQLLQGPAAGKKGGKVPAYMQAQLANYNAGLDRLMAAGPQAGTLGSF